MSCTSFRVCFIEENTIEKCPLHGSIQKPERRIADHDIGASNVSQENAIFPSNLLPSYGQTSRLYGDRYEKIPRHLATEEQYISRLGTESVCRFMKIMLHPVSRHSCIRCGSSNTVSQSLKNTPVIYYTYKKQDRVFANTSSPKPIAVLPTVCVSVPIKF